MNNYSITSNTEFIQKNKNFLELFFWRNHGIILMLYPACFGTVFRKIFMKRGR